MNGMKPQTSHVKEIYKAKHAKTVPNTFQESLDSLVMILAVTKEQDTKYNGNKKTKGKDVELNKEKPGEERNV